MRPFKPSSGNRVLATCCVLGAGFIISAHANNPLPFVAALMLVAAIAFIVSIAED
jgi:hypothetical protein